MTPQSADAGSIGPPWYRRGFVPGWITLGAAVLFTAAGAIAEQLGAPECRIGGTCGPEPIRTLGFGLFAAVIVAAFLQPRVARLLAAAFVVSYLVAGGVEVSQQWWVDLAGVAFVAIVAFVTWPGYVKVPGLADRAATFRMRVPADSKNTLVRPWWLLGCAACVVAAVAGLVGYSVSEPGEAAADWLLVTGLGGGMAVVFGGRAADRSFARQHFLRRKQPGRRCTVLPLRFETIVVPDDGDKVLVVPSSVWEELRLARMWADAEPDGCPATLYGRPASGQWLAVGIAGQILVSRGPAWVEERNASLREAVMLMRHLADAVPDTDIADAIRRTADRYAAEVGEPDGTLPGS